MGEATARERLRCRAGPLPTYGYQGGEPVARPGRDLPLIGSGNAHPRTAPFSIARVGVPGDLSAQRTRTPSMTTAAGSARTAGSFLGSSW